MCDAGRSLDFRGGWWWQKSCNYSFSDFFDPGSLGRRPQNKIVESKSIESKFISHPKCTRQPVAQSWVVAKSESDYAKILQLWFDDTVIETCRNLNLSAKPSQRF
jgi:hypothetical protein